MNQLYLLYLTSLLHNLSTIVTKPLEVVLGWLFTVILVLLPLFVHPRHRLHQANYPKPLWPWNWAGSEKMWTSDSKWGCMLRTGQSLLGNALIKLVHMHLGRGLFLSLFQKTYWLIVIIDWRRPPPHRNSWRKEPVGNY